MWSSIIVKKIERLKQKIDHIDDDTYDHSLSFAVEDEIKSLEMAIEDMRVSLKKSRRIPQSNVSKYIT